MALNASGPISLAGSTSGQSIAVELGKSATGQISLNDTDVRALAGVPSGAIIMPTNFWGKSSVTYFLGTVNNSVSGNNYWYGRDYMYPPTTTGTAGSYSIGLLTNSSLGVSILSIDETGVLLGNGQKQITDWGKSNEGSFTVITNGGTFYMVGMNGNGYLGVASYTGSNFYASSLSQNWGKEITNGSVLVPSLQRGDFAAYDDSGNIYVGARYNFSSTDYQAIWKFNSSGTEITKKLYSPANSYVFQGMTTKVESGLICTYGQGFPAYITVLDSGNFNEQWARLIYGTTGGGSQTYFYVKAAAFDTSGNLYVVGSNGGFGAYGPRIIKFNTIGTVLWRREFGILAPSQNNDEPMVVYVNPATGDVYIGCSFALSGNYRGGLVKFNSSGTFQWSRSFKKTANNDYANIKSVYVNPKDGALLVSMYVSGNSTAERMGMLMKLPANGSFTGTRTVNSISITIADEGSWDIDTATTFDTMGASTTSTNSLSFGTWNPTEQNSSNYTFPKTNL